MGDVRRIDGEDAEQAAVTLDDLAREGARRMIAAALEVEVEEYVGSLAEERAKTASGWWFATAAPVSGA